MNSKLMQRLIMVFSLVGLPFAAIAQSAPNGAPPQQAAATSSISKKDQANFEKAAPKVMKLIEERDGKLRGAKGPEAAQKIQASYYKKMSTIIKNNGLSVEKFNAMASKQSQ